ncbi:MAG TPA: PEGA domain-containing protein, partial [Kofleriaceae bacterium]
PRASRKTPQGGVQQNVLQAIVGAKPAEPMPAPRPPRAETPPESGRSEDSGAQTIPQQPSPIPPRGTGPPPMPSTHGGPPPQHGMPHPGPYGTPQGQPPHPGTPPQAFSGYAADASGLPMTPPQGVPVAQNYGPPYQHQPYPGYPPQQGYPQPGYPGYPQQGYPGYQPPQVTPGALYQLQPHGAPPPSPMSLTGQIRLFEADEIPDKYKVSGGGGRWVKLVIAGILAISVAAGVTFFIIKSTQDTPPEVGTIRVESVPPGAEVTFDNTRLAGVTPMNIDSVPVGTRHEIKVELARHKPYVETVDIPKRGGEVPVKAFLTPITGKLTVITDPDGAEIWVDGKLRGRAPMTITDIDMSSAKQLELRLKDYQPHVQALQWPDNGKIDINQKLLR